MAPLNAAGLKILIADASEDDRRHVVNALGQVDASISCMEAPEIEGASTLCLEQTFDCALLGYFQPADDAAKSVGALHEQYPYMAIVVTAHQSDDSMAAEFVKQGALDYLKKVNVTPESLRRSVLNAVEKARLQQRADRQRSQLESFSGVLVHDLKAPLQTVQSFTTLIEQSIESGDSADTLEYCRRARHISNRAVALIEALQLYNKAEDQVSFEPVDMAQVMHDTISNLNHAIRSRGACVTYDQLPVVSGNAPLLTQMLQNLISNGIKFCQAKTPEVHVDARPAHEDGWLFAVRDNGIGIPDIYQNEVFEPFKRLHGVGEYEGSGLGLATCKRVLDRHNGKIWSESREGHGTTLFFTLPAP